jgi:hypothetical protein
MHKQQYAQAAGIPVFPYSQRGSVNSARLPVSGLFKSMSVSRYSLQIFRVQLAQIRSSRTYDGAANFSAIQEIYP